MTRTARIHLLLHLAFVLFLLSPVAGRAEIIDRVVAVVNNDVITLHDLKEEGEELFKRIRQEVPPDEQEEAMRRVRQELLAALIEKKLLEQRAKETGVSVSEAEVDAAIDRLLAQNRVSREQFLRELRSSGTTEAAYRDRLRTQLLQSKLIGYEVRSRIVVTDKKVKEYYDRHFAGKDQADGYHILQMGFAWKGEDSPSSRQAARERAEEARKLALAGQNFKELAETYSDLPSAEDGGDIGVFKEEEMAPYMREVIVRLQPGGISDVVETQSGFQFFKLLSVKEGEIIQQASFEHLKNELRDKVYQEEAREQFENWLQELRDEAYIRKLL
jgi:peptidyl-prolyl cis-trans isomerase SurA